MIIVFPGALNTSERGSGNTTPGLWCFWGRAIVCYRQTIADRNFTDDGGSWSGNSGGTTYVITKHPAAQGVTNAYFGENWYVSIPNMKKLARLRITIP